MAEQYKLIIEQAEIPKVSTAKGSALDREYKLEIKTPESLVLQLGAFDLTTQYKITIEVIG